MLMIVVVAVVALTAGAALAHTVGPHQHFVVTPTGEQVAFGPDRCANAQTEEGFQQFHHNVHFGHTGPTPVLQAFAQPNNPVGFAAAGCP